MIHKRSLSKYRRLRRYSALNEIDYYFEREKLIRQAVQSARLDHVPTKGNSGGEHYNGPTEREAIRNLQEVRQVWLNQDELIDYPERWLKVIDASYAMFDGNLAKAISAVYAGENRIRVCLEHHISESTYYRGLKELQSFAMAVACQLGLIKIIDMDNNKG